MMSVDSIPVDLGDIPEITDSLSARTIPLQRGLKRIDTTKPATWAELDKIVSLMDELPCVEDFPRQDIGREPLNKWA